MQYRTSYSTYPYRSQYNKSSGHVLSSIPEDTRKGDKSSSYSNLSTNGRYGGGSGGGADTMSSRPYSSRLPPRSPQPSYSFASNNTATSSDKPYSSFSSTSYSRSTSAGSGYSNVARLANRFDTSSSSSYQPSRRLPSSMSHSTSSLSSSSSAVVGGFGGGRSTYDSGMRSYNSARTLNDSSNSYGSRYGTTSTSSYEPRYSSGSAATSTRYGGSTSAVDRYSSPSRTLGATSSYSNIGAGGRYGSGDIGSSSTPLASSYRSPTRDYTSASSSHPPRSYSYSSGLGGSGSTSNVYSPSSGAMSRSTYTPSYRASDYGSRYSSAKRSDDYGGSSGRLYTSLSDAHNNIAGRRSSSSMPRQDSVIKISSTPPTPTESVAPSWREHSLGAVVDNKSSSWTDNLKVDTYATPAGFTLAKPTLPVASDKSQGNGRRDSLTAAEEEFNVFYDRYVTHSPIMELDRPADGPNGQSSGNNNDEQGTADDSAYSSRMEESGTTGTKDGSETLSRSDNGQEEEEEEDEIEYEAEEVTSEPETDVTAQKHDEEASETEKEDQLTVGKAAETDGTTDEELKKATDVSSSGKAALDVEPAWRQFASSFEEDEEEVEDVEEEADDEADANKGRAMTDSMYESTTVWPSAPSKQNQHEEEEEEEEESTTPEPINKPRRKMMLSFTDAIKRRCEEVTGVAAEEEEPKREYAKYPTMSSSDCWQQFSFYEDDDDGEADGADGEEEATDQVPPWQQFIDYSIPLKPSKYHIQVQSTNQSESEYTSDEDAAPPAAPVGQNRRSSVPGGKPQQFMRLLAPPKDSGADTSSEVESDYEAARDASVGPTEPPSGNRTFPFLPNEEKTEERGRVEAHMAQPPPVFSIKVTYDDDAWAEEESVGTISDYEDFSDEEEEDEDDEEEEEDRQGSLTPTRGRTPALEVPQIMITSTDMIETEAQPASRRLLEREETLKESSIEPDEEEEEASSYASNDESSKKPTDQQRHVIELTYKQPKEDEETYVDAPTLADQDEIKVDIYDDTASDFMPSPGTRMLGEQQRDTSTAERSDQESEHRRRAKSLEVQSAKQVSENISQERADRFYPKKEDEAKALLRTAKGVAETAKSVQVQPKVAPTPVAQKAAVAAVAPKASTPAPSPAKVAPAAQAKAKSEEPPAKKEVLLPCQQFGVQQRQDAVGERVDPYSYKKPSETWAKKSVIPDPKLEKGVAVKTVSTKVAPEKSPEPPKKVEEPKKPETKKIEEPKKPVEAIKKPTVEVQKTSTTPGKPEEPQKKPTEPRRGSGLVGAMANKFKETPAPVADSRAKPTEPQKPATLEDRSSLAPSNRQNQRSLSPQSPRTADHKRTSSQPPAPAEPQGPSFEEQMDELRKKMKMGTSSLSQQMKDMSRGMVDATVNAKLAAEVATTRGLIDDAANLRQQVSQKYDKWQTKAQEEMEKRERELQQPLTIKKPIVDASKASSISPAESSRRLQQQQQPRATSELASTPAQKPTEEEKPQPKKTGVASTREPGKILSPFAEKVRRESELAKAAVDEQAKRETARRELLQKQKLEEQQKQIEQQRLTEQRKVQEQQKLQEQKRLKEQQQKLQQDQQKAKDLQKQKQPAQTLEQLLAQQTQQQQQQKPARIPAAPVARRHEPEGESDHDATARKLPFGQRQAPGQASKPQAPAQTTAEKKAGESVATSKIMESKKEIPELSKSKVTKAEMVEQGTAGQAQIKSGQQQMQAELNKGKLHPAGEAALIKKTKKWRRRRPTRFIGQVQDIDQLLNINSNNAKSKVGNFDQFELFYENCSRDTRRVINGGKTSANGMKLSKIFIWDMSDVDELYAQNDLRTLMSQFSPTSKVAFNFDAVATKKIGDLKQHAKLKTDKFRRPGDGGQGGGGGKKVDESTFQIYRSYDGGQGDYGTYLDSDLSLAEQPDELAVLRDGKRTSLVLRTQLSVRVHTIIEKLLNSTGRELRRALFSLKQIFQDDKDLVHEFVQNDGLACLIKVGAEADQNYQNYILRAIGQVMLYVDGMNGCIAHNETIQWLYSLLSSPYRLVVKTALKLLLVFVEYTESNSLLLLAAVYIVDKNRGAIPWSNLVQLLTNKDNAGGDLELLIFAMTLLNTTLNGIPDQDTYYDVVDALEEQGIEEAIRKLCSLGNKDLIDQCRQYEAVLREEDGAPDDNGSATSPNGPAANIAKMRQTPRTRTGSSDRKSQRKRIGSDRKDVDENRNSASSTSSPRHQQQYNGSNSKSRLDSTGSSAAKVRAPPLLQKVPAQGHPQWDQQSSPTETPGLPANKRLTMDLLYKKTAANGGRAADDDDEMDEKTSTMSTKKPSLASLIHQESTETHERDINANLQKTRCPPPALPDLSQLSLENANANSTQGNNGDSPMSPPPNGTRSSKGSMGAVHSLADRWQKSEGGQLDNQPSTTTASASSAADEDEGVGGNAFASALAKARKDRDKKEAARPQVDSRKESEIQWEQAMQNWKERPLIINDLDFTELDDSDDQDPVRVSMMAGKQSTNAYGGGAMINPYTGVAYGGSGAPPPPPAFGGGVPPPPPPGGAFGVPPPPRLSPGGAGGANNRAPSPNQQAQQQQSSKMVKLFWKEAQFDQQLPGVDNKAVFWQKVKPVDIDVEKLNQLFETKTKDVVAKKKEDTKTEIRILDTKRSNAINIGLKKLPAPSSIRQAITKFDSAILNKEGIEKILSTMMPTEEEKERINEALALNPDVNLGEAEKFLVMMGEIPQLHARLRLWLFMLDYSNIEKEVADPLMDLKLAMQELDESKTFQYVMATLLAVGNYLNGAEIKGFQLEYLAKVPEVKDTVHKHSLVYHLCTIVMEKFPDATDLYSELGAVVRCARVDFDEIDQNLQRLEKDCKASWDYLRLIAKHESQALKQKMSEFLTECVQRIVTLKMIHRRVINRFRKFLLYMGMPQHSIKDTKVNSICKTIAEFALEYRTCRDKMQQQKKRLAEKRERNKTRGKMITETRQLHPQQNGGESGGASGVQRDDDGRRQHDELSRVLQRASGRGDEDGGGQGGASPNPWVSFPGARLRSTRQPATSANSTLERSFGASSAASGGGGGGQESPDDEILDGLVKAATVKTDPSRVEQRRKARQFNRKSLRRTRTLKLVEDQIGGGDDESPAEGSRNY